MQTNLKQIVISFWNDITEKRVINAASMLTYSTLLAIVPVAAMVFAIARGFGYNKYIETWFRSALAGHPQVVDTLIGFVNSYLVHTQSGLIFGIGLIFMLYTVLMLTRNIEQVFNDIWNVHKQRDFFRSVTDYLAMFFLLPIFIIVLSGITIWASSLSKLLNEIYVIGPLVRFGISIIPFLMLVGIITMLYIFMPNTRVKCRNAILPAIGAALALELLQYFYVHSQVWVSNYNAIYGSFAALPLLMLWLQFTWTVILIGAEMSYAEQNVEEFRLYQTPELSIRYRYMLSAILLSRICKRFNDGLQPYTINQLKKETHLPRRIINELVFDMIKAKLIVEVGLDSKGIYREQALMPAESIENITVGMLISRLESLHPWINERNISIHEMISSDTWREIIRQRHQYLKAQNNTKLYQL